MTVGLAFGMTASFFAPAGYAAIAFTAGNMIGNLLFPQKLPEVTREGPRLEDTRVHTSAYGKIIPLLKGRDRLAMNLIYAADFVDHPTVTTEEVGGKGGGPSQKVTTIVHNYKCNFAGLICRGPTIGPRKMWINGELVMNYDSALPAGTVVKSNDKWSGSMTIYTGSSTQAQDPIMVADKGANRVSAHRNYAYVVFELFDVTKWRTIPQIEFEWIENGATGPLIQYYNGTATTAVAAAQSPTTYIALRNVVCNLDYGSSPTDVSPARLAFLDISTNTYSFTSFPATYYTPSLNKGLHFRYIKEWDQILAGAYYIDSGFRSTIAFNALSKQFIGAWRETLFAVGLVETEALSIDTAKNQAVVSTPGSGTGYKLIALDEDTHLPLVNSGADVTLPETPYAGEVDKEGNHWLMGSVGLIRITPSRVVTRFDFDSDGRFNHGLDRVVYDKSRHCLFYFSAAVSGLHYLKKFDIATLTFSRVGAGISNSGSGPFMYSGRILFAVEDDFIVSVSGGTSGPFAAWTINPDTGAFTTYTIPDPGGAHFVGMFGYAPGVIWASSAAWINGADSNKGVGELRFKSVTANPVTLAALITAICAEVGYTAGELDVSHSYLTSTTVAGFTIARDCTGRAALEQILMVFMIDAVESDGKIKFVPRGGPTITVIPAEEIGACDWSELPNPRAKTTRGMETELPMEFRLGYKARDANYAPGMQYARRQTVKSKQLQTVQTALVLGDTEAAQAAYKALYSQWANRFKVEFSTSIKYGHLEPTDIVRITRNNIIFTLRLLDKHETANRINWIGVTEDLSVYSNEVTGAPLPAPITTIGGKSSTIFHLLDIPLLRAADDGSIIYTVATGTNQYWSEAALYKSTDGATTFNQTGVTYITRSPMGNAVTKLGNWLGGNQYDPNGFEVQLEPGSGTLSSISVGRLLAGENHFLVGNEIIGARLAEYTGTNKVRLSCLLRGRAGTEQHMATHTAGERVILLSTQTLKRLEQSTTDVGQTRYYKAPSQDQSLAEALISGFTFTDVARTPLSLSYGGGYRNASGDVILSARRRTRYNSRWGQTSRALGEYDANGAAYEFYELEIWNSTFTTLKRTVTGLTSPSYTYTAAQQITDFGGTQSTVYYRWYQMSYFVGRGFALQGSR